MFLKKFQIEFLNKIFKKSNRKQEVLSISSGSERPSDVVNVFNYKPASDGEELRSLSIEQGTVIYYRTIDKFLVYRVISYSTSQQYNMCNVDLNEFETLDELKEFYSNSFLKVNFVNLLSVDYVYLFKSGIHVEGQDLRTNTQVLNDKVVHCLYSNGFLNDVLIHTSRFDVEFYKPFDGNYHKRTVDGWSYEIIDEYLKEGRMKMFLSSETLFFYDKILKQIKSEPSSLLMELKYTCDGNGNSLNSCNNLGIQIS